LLARWGRLPQARRIAAEDPMSMAFSRPQDAAAVRWQLAQLGTLAPRQFVGVGERQLQAVRAMRCLGVLAATSAAIYDMSRAEGTAVAALYVPALSVPACEVLAQRGTPEAQRALIELASRAVQPIAARNAAAAAFRASTEKYGVLLSAAEVRRQYDRYTQSGSQDAATQCVLSSLLDSIEAPTQPVGARKPAPLAPAAKASK
jgi:hypothetical protein